jgi:hypothetical protein
LWLPINAEHNACLFTSWRAAGSLVRQFRVRQKFSLADNLEAAAGLAYDFQSDSVAPTASLIYRLDPDNKKSRIELSSTDKKLLLRKGWQVGFQNLLCAHD